MPIHIRAGEGDVAERVVIVGDPARARQLSGLLTDVKVVNENRGFITYTGMYEGVRVSVAVHGVGAPSAAIVIEELIKLGAKLIIRLGTTGALRSEIGIGDVIVPTGSAYNPGGIYMQ
ncbi:MAG: nucleoside phosphorylase, partial [Vulcanisaeta sp.]